MHFKEKKVQMRKQASKSDASSRPNRIISPSSSRKKFSKSPILVVSASSSGGQGKRCTRLNKRNEKGKDLGAINNNRTK